MIESTTGLVLRLRPLTETSLIVNWLTPNLGRLSTVAKGARRPKSPFHGRLDLLFEADFSFNRSRSSELHALREVSVRQTHESLRHDLSYLQQAAYCVGLIEQTTETETPLGVLFDLVQSFLKSLPSRPAQPQSVFGLELKLLSELGLQPDLDRSALSKGAQALVAQFQQADWATISRLRLSRAQVVELRQFLHGFLIFHLGRLPKGRDAALVMSEENKLPNPN